eukprot:CAMPEP_0202343604 /NCGR_PEP_ID=MMETSP1126-20121109/3647_1 /ASSEMBLY_ACC=CAM_ASM_000457 /TAXON_ID=3047 /ORGANISM="Dunaliella tertiolecta, Strain CCMP1320" /LENGTH=123 /DNA_ID=CAMNT_0048934683 /DNA_START=656 /DNA_END=1026 /DNA_ORIENTATION=+
MGLGLTDPQHCADSDSAAFAVQAATALIVSQWLTATALSLAGPVLRASSSGADCDRPQPATALTALYGFDCGGADCDRLSAMASTTMALMVTGHSADSQDRVGCGGAEGAGAGNMAGLAWKRE